MQSGNLGLIIAIVVLLGLAAVLCLMGSLFIANMRESAKARDAAAQSRRDAQQKLSESRVHDLRPLLGNVPDSGGIHLDIHTPPEAVPVLAVEAELRELLAAVVAYAASVMRAGTTLQVSARAEGNQAVVHWHDPDAFDARPPLARFFDSAQAVASGARAKACEGIASRHGGRIYSAPGTGGVLGLTLRLPLSA